MSSSTENIRHQRVLVLMMTFIPLIVIGMISTIIYTNNTRNNSANAAVLLSNNFESGTGWSMQRVSADRLSTVSQTDNGVGAPQGNKLARFELRQGDNPLAQWCCAGTNRVEFTTSTNETKGQERWYSWYQFFNPNYPSYDTYPESQNQGWQIFAQWHGNDSVSPPLAFWAAKDNVVLATGNGNSYIEHWRGAMNKGQWNHIKMRVLWADSGSISLWYNGAKVLEKSGIDTVTNPPLYFKTGMYRPQSLSQTAITYMDDFKMGQFEADVNSTAPSPTPTPTPTPPPPALTPSPSPTPTPPAPTPGQSPYGGSARSLPGKIEAEDYDNGGEGVAYHDTSSTNITAKYRNDAVDIETCAEGGYNIGYNDPSEWREHTINAQAGTYTIAARVAAAFSGGQLAIKLDGQTLGTVNVPNTGGWQTYQMVTLNNISIPGGSNKILRFETLGNSYTINYVTFTLSSGSTNPSPTPAPAPNPTPSQPAPPITIPGANPTTPVVLPSNLPKQADGTLIADFNGDGLNDVVKDINNDGQIDPTNEIIIDGTTDQDLTNMNLPPVSLDSPSASLFENETLPKSNSITIKAGPLPEVTLPKPVAYTFLVAQGLAIPGIGIYLAITKLALFASIRGKLGV